MLSYYQILQVEETATDVEIKQAYRKLSKVLHPDLNNNTAEANAIFRLLRQAYETLSDPLKRKAYDIDPSPINNEESDNVRLESYKKQNEKQGRKLKEYEKTLKDYEQSVYQKDQRYRELANEISGLKKRILKSENLTVERLKLAKKERDLQVDLVTDKQKEFSWIMIILLIVGANVGMFLSYYAIRDAFSFLFY